MNNIKGAEELKFFVHMIESIVKGLNISLDFLQQKLDLKFEVFFTFLFKTRASCTSSYYPFFFFFRWGWGGSEIRSV